MFRQIGYKKCGNSFLMKNKRYGKPNKCQKCLKCLSNVSGQN